MTPVATPTERLQAFVDHEHSVGWLVLNQPDKHNAISSDMFAGLTEVLAGWEADDAVRVVVVRGIGERAFASGADLGEISGRSGEGPSEGGATRGATLVSSKPVIALIHGYCIGGGLMVAMEADLRVAAADAVFGIPAARLGAGYPYESVQRLVALVGPAHASSILLTGDRFDAATAARIGLVNEVVASDDLDRHVARLAAHLAGNAPLSLAASKTSIAAAAGFAGATIEEATRRILGCWGSEDFEEGRSAFAEKRAPRFHGR